MEVIQGKKQLFVGHNNYISVETYRSSDGLQFGLKAHLLVLLINVPCQKSGTYCATDISCRVDISCTQKMDPAEMNSQ